MNIRVFAASFAVVVGALSAASADDQPFGAAGLRNLTRQSDAVVIAKSPTKVKSDSPTDRDLKRAKYAFYSVQTARVLKGEVRAGEKVTIALPLSFDVKSERDLQDKMVFMKSAPELRAESGEANPTFIAVGGRNGVVPAVEPKRIAAVQSYLLIRGSRNEPMDLGKLLSWTEEHISGNDSFLQGSAVVDLYQERDDARAVKQLRDALRLERVPETSRVTAIKALQISMEPTAFQALKTIAEDSKTLASTKRLAVDAVGKMPSGLEQVQRWTVANDQDLSSAAKASISRTSRGEFD